MINIEKHTHSTHLWHIMKMLDSLSGDENTETTQVETWELCETPFMVKSRKIQGLILLDSRAFHMFYYGAFRKREVRLKGGDFTLRCPE